jgi:hypothetical protein
VAVKQKREPVSHNVSVRFREAEVKAVEEVAFKDDMSMGAWIRKNTLKTLKKLGMDFSTNGDTATTNGKGT